MPFRYSFAILSIKELLIVLLAACVFLLVTSIGGMAALQISKRQFEAEAQNIAAVLRSGIDVAEGVVTSLDASNYSDADHLQIQSHFSKVLNQYEYVTGLGRFESSGRDQLPDLEMRLLDAEVIADIAWYFDSKGDVATAKALSAADTYLPLTVFKSRFVSQAETYVDLTGFDLAALNNSQTLSALEKSSGQSIVAPLPADWNRPGELLLFRSGTRNDNAGRGYLLELDLDEMASSGGIEIQLFDIELAMFSEQSEFATESSYEMLYRQSAELKTDLKFDKSFKKNNWLSTFSLGDKTISLEISRPTGLSVKVVVLLLVAASLLSLMFLTIMQLVRKKRHALKLRRIESEKLYVARYRAAVTLASIDDAVITTDVEEKILYVNEAAENLLGYTEAEIQGHHVDSVVVHSSEDGNLVLYSADNSRRYINKKQSSLRDLNGEHTGHVIVLRDISVEHALTQELTHKVNHDSLTGLSNRLNFESQLQNLIADSEGIDKAYSDSGHVLCFIDLDRFKEINDTCGHDAGDELLVQVAQTFSANVRDYDLVARLGGDEFGIVLRNCTRSSAKDVTARIQACFQSFFFSYDDHVFPVRCSIGFVHFMPETSEFDDVIKTADAACFDAKHLGRNSVCERIIGDSTKQVDQGSMWLPRLKYALQTESFELLTQSVVSLQDGSSTAHEVLLRLNEEGELISPTAFMKSAVRYEIAESIDKWVVRKTIASLASLRHEFMEDHFIINLSSQSIQSEEFQDFLREQINLAAIDPARLCFDIKESDLLSKPAKSEEFCRALRSMGCEVALDDFGAGMTSFALLKTIPVTTLKIDGSLIRNLDSVSVAGDEFNADQAMVRSIHSFASSMGLSMIAEQVESAGCLEILRSLGVGYAQGSAVAEEVPFDTLQLDNGVDLKAA